MELEVLKKKLSSYRTDGGKIKNVSDELLLEILFSWENWTGSAYDFYKGIGTNNKALARFIGKAKKLKREGHSVPFEEIKVDNITDTPHSAQLICDIEVQDKNKKIRFRKVDHLVEYLKKVA